MENEFDTGLGGDVGGEVSVEQVAGAPLPPPKGIAPSAAPSEYAPFVFEVIRHDERKEAASRSMAQAITKNPDEYARYVRLSKLTGMDPDLLLEDKEVEKEAQHRAKMGSIDFDSLIRTNPMTAEFLSDPQTAAVVQDDLPFFQRIENVFSSLGSGYRTAESQEEMFALARKLMDTGKLSPMEQARLEKLQGDEAHKARAEQMQGLPENWSRDLGYSMRQFIKSTEAAGFGAGVGGLLGFGAGTVMPGVGNVAGGTAGIIAGGITGAANYSYDMERAGAFLELSRVRDINNQPIDPRTAKVVANAVGVMNAAIETGSDLVLARMVPGVKGWMDKLGKEGIKTEMRRRAAEALRNPTTRQIILQASMKIGGMASVEGIEEFVQGLIGAGGREVAQAVSNQQFKEDSLSDDVRQASDEAMRAFRGTLLLMTPVGAMHYSAMRQQQIQVRRNKEFFDELSSAITDSKAHQRLPEKTREFIDVLKKDSEIKAAFIDAGRFNQYFQSKGLDAGAVVEEVLGAEGADQFQQALALGGDLIIPIDKYAEKLAGTEHHQGLAEDLRLRQGDESEREFKLAEANLTQDEKILRDMAESAQDSIKADEPAQRVYRDMYGAALNGGASPSQAATWAAIEAARYRTRASRIEGADAYSLWQEEGGLDISRPMPEVLTKYRGSEPMVDSLLNTMRERKIPVESPDHPLTDDQRTLKSQVEELGRVLEERGLDIDSLTNEQIRAQLFRPQEFDAEGGRVYNAGIGDQTYDQPLDVYKYSNGLPGFANDQFTLSAPQEIGTWVGGTRSVGYDIEVNHRRVGTVVLAVRNEQVSGLLAIEIDPELQRSGIGRQVMGSLVETYGDIEIYGIRDSAVEFWEKMGVKFNEAQDELERNGILTREAYARASAGRAGIRQGAAGTTRTVQDFIEAGLVSESGLTGPQQVFRATRPGQPAELTPGSWVTDDEQMAATVYAPGESGEAQGIVTQHEVPGEHLIKVHPGGYIYAPPGTDISSVLRYRNSSGRAVTFGDLLAQKTFYQSAPLWYSALHQSVAAVKAQKAPASQWLDIIRSLKGVKKDEIKWSGIEEWLILRSKQSTTRDEVLQFLDQNGVKVQDEFNAGRDDTGDYPDWVYERARDESYDVMQDRYPDVEDLEEAIGDELEEEFDDLVRERVQEIAEEEDLTTTGEYSDYQLPGGKDYGELLLTLPREFGETKDVRYYITAEDGRPLGRRYFRSKNDAEYDYEAMTGRTIEEDGLSVVAETLTEFGDYRSPHWYEVPNVLAHVRFNTRIDAEGKRVLFLEEIQSDWAQEGREEGFAKRTGDGFIFFEEGNFVIRKNDGTKTNGSWDSWEEARSAYIELAFQYPEKYTRPSQPGFIPSAPFVTDTKAWVALVMKRMIRYAAENGFNRVAWTTGDQQNARWDLAQHIDKITIGDDPDNEGALEMTVWNRGEDDPYSRTTSFETLPDEIGKDLAAEIERRYESGENPVEIDFKKEGGRLVGGDGMRAFYDGIVPQVANDLLRRLGGEKVKEIPVIGEMVGRDRTPFDEAGVQPGFDITPELRKSALAGMPLFQKKRGSVTLGENYRLIQLLEDADLSTFLHELGHTWLEELQRDAKREGASEQVRRDWEVVRGWLGVAPDEAIPVVAHEQFARGAEAWFMEGVSPSVALREIFQKLKAWMQSVYKSLDELDVKLNDDIRAVFDRMLASDEEIETARRYQAYAPIFSTPEQAKMTPAEWSAYTKATEGARADAQDQVTRRVMRELRRENEKWWKEELARVAGAVRREALEMPVYKAIWLLTRGEFSDGTKPDQPIKLSKQALIAVYGEAYLKELSPQKLRTSGWVYSAEGGIHQDVVAGIVGFDSGDEMIKAITSAAPMNEWVEAEARQRMLELHGDVLNDGSLADEALRAVHNDRQAEALEIELRVLRRKRAEVEPLLRAAKAEERAKQQKARQVLDFNIPAAVLRDMARREIGAMRVAHVDPVHYSHAEARAGRESFELAAKGDFDGAAEAKQRQIMNHFFYREAIRARKDVDRGVGHMQRLSYTKARARIGRAGQEWLEQLDAILERYSLSPLTQQHKARSLLEWAKIVEQATGESIALSPEVLNEAHMVNYRELTVDQFRALHDSVSSIEHVARKITQVMRNGRAFEKAEMVKELVNVAEHALTTVRPLPETNKVYGQAKTFFELTRGFFAANLRPEKIIERLDGGTSGIWHDLFWNPAVDAQTRRDELRVLIMKPLAEFLHKGMPKTRRARMSDAVHLQTLGKSLTRRTLIGVALNVGNASNRDKLMRGGMWFGEDWSPITDVQLAEMLDQLDHDDWKMVQMIWDSVAQLYPHLDDLNRRAVGLPLDRVQPSPVNTKFGVFDGGYWPAVADPRHSKVGEQQENSEALITDVFAPRYPKAATAHSFREARTEAAYPIQLDWERVLSGHVDKAITDIAYHEWVKQSRRLLENQQIKKVIQNRLGEHVYRGLEEWLVHQVMPVTGGYSGNVAIDNITNTLISNTAIAALGFKAATAIGNIAVAPIQASHQVSPWYQVRALAKYLSNPIRATEAVFAVSGEMRHRYEHLDQTFNVITKTLEGRDTTRAMIGRLAMAIHRQADRITSTFIWMAKYQQEIDANRSPEQAARLADKTIRTTQMAGAPKDLSSFERDPRYRMFKLFIGPMIVMQNEMRGAVAGKGVRAIITPKVWSTMLATWILPAVMFELAVGRGPDDDDDLNWWQWALLKMLVYPALTVPFVRDGANAIEQMIEGKGALTRSNPLADLVMLSGKAVRSVFKEDAEASDYMKAIAKAAGMATGLPVGQGILLGEFLYGAISGDQPIEGPEDLKYLIYKRKDE